MRKSKTEAALNAKRKIVHHTPLERLAMTRRKRKEGPSGLKRAERRKEKRLAFAQTVLLKDDVAIAVIEGVHVDDLTRMSDDVRAALEAGTWHEAEGDDGSK